MILLSKGTSAPVATFLKGNGAILPLFHRSLGSLELPMMLLRKGTCVPHFKGQAGQFPSHAPPFQRRCSFLYQFFSWSGSRGSIPRRFRNSSRFSTTTVCSTRRWDQTGSEMLSRHLVLRRRWASLPRCSQHDASSTLSENVCGVFVLEMLLRSCLITQRKSRLGC